MADKTTILNRLTKNHKKLKKWLSQGPIEAWRLYDRDIPEYPYIIDIYKDSAILYEKGKRLDDSRENQDKIKEHQEHIFWAIRELLNIPEHKIWLKKREKKKGKNQYEAEVSGAFIDTINENGCLYKVNLTNYLDSGLFLDHRPMRKRIREEIKGKSFLNLFCYTGSFSVAAAMGGASKVVSVDMSKTYLSWARENFELNKLPLKKAEFVHSDVFEFLKANEESFDVIFCDPPSFSNSKRMEGSFDVQRDHEGLIRLCLSKLNSGGKLYFSNNFRKFKLDPKLIEEFAPKDISLKTIPQDFSDLKIHSCFEFTK